LPVQVRLNSPNGMAAIALRREEALGLGVAAVAHVALVALLVLRPATPSPVPPPERVTVTLSEDIGLTSTSPLPQADPAPDLAPELGEPPAPAPEPEPALPPPPRPEPVKRQAPPPPKPVAKPAPQPVAKPAPAKPTPRASAPAQTPAKNAAQTPAKTPAKTAAPRPAASASAAAKPSTRAGGSRIGDDFLKGLTGASTTGKSTTPPAAAIGPAVRSALAGAISREIKPHWVAPQGADAEKLVSVLSFSLNPDGSLAGKPTLVRQEGITDANRAQAGRHAEQAIRAVQLAAPFDLPNEHYDAWKRVASFRFDKRLSQ